MIILGIETSCDDTAVGILKFNGDKKPLVLANKVSSQIKLHAEFGGVVPNLAAREHSKNIIPVLKEALKEAEISPERIDLITVTKGPGLIPALLVGTNFAKTISYLWKKPLLGIHHIEGHIYANIIGDKNHLSEADYRFPLLALVVSGGHTQLVLMKNHLQYEIIGETQDDAVGEAFDKVARILNLGYPGGPIISAKADLSKKEKFLSTESALQFPRPMINSPDFNFSFSGLKTAVLYKTQELKKNDSLEKNIPEICYEFQQACIDVLIHKTVKAIKKYNSRTVVLAGGVSANKELRRQLKEVVAKQPNNIDYIAPEITYTADNASMIAVAGYFRWQRMNEQEKEKSLQNWRTLQADAGLKIG